MATNCSLLQQQLIRSVTYPALTYNIMHNIIKNYYYTIKMFNKPLINYQNMGFCIESWLPTRPFR